jgi:hypothetical protein
MSIDDELRMDDEENLREIAFIRKQLPSELKERYTDDELLWNDAVNMRRTEPGDIFEYVSKWVAFQERYNEVLPTIPIYSNIYFDFFNQYLQNYYITGQVTWSQAILPAYFALESYETVPEETEGEGAEDTESFED